MVKREGRVVAEKARRGRVRREVVKPHAVFLIRAEKHRQPFQFPFRPIAFRPRCEARGGVKLFTHRRRFPDNLNPQYFYVIYIHGPMCESK